MNLQLYIGQTQLRGAISRYAAHYNLLEIRGEARRIPRVSVLQRWRAEVSNSFAFAWVLDHEVGRLSGDCTALIEQAISSARALDARWLVVQTNPTVGPSRRTRERLGALFSRLNDSGIRLAWEPHGVWQPEEAMALGQEFGVHYVRDISRGETTSERVVYSRLPGLGTAARLSAGALEKSAKNLVGASEAYIVVAGDGARKLREHLPGLVSSMSQTDASDRRVSDSVQVFGDSSSISGTIRSDLRATVLGEKREQYDYDAVEGDDSLYDDEDDDGELTDDKQNGFCAYDSKDNGVLVEGDVATDDEDVGSRAKRSGPRRSLSRDKSSRTGRNR